MLVADGSVFFDGSQILASKQCEISELDEHGNAKAV